MKWFNWARVHIGSSGKINYQVLQRFEEWKLKGMEFRVEPRSDVELLKGPCLSFQPPRHFLEHRSHVTFVYFQLKGNWTKKKETPITLNFKVMNSVMTRISLGLIWRNASKETVVLGLFWARKRKTRRHRSGFSPGRLMCFNPVARLTIASAIDGSLLNGLF